MNADKKRNQSMEIEAVSTDEKLANVISESDFRDLLNSEIGLSPLAYGTKFESDDLVRAENVILTDFDIVEYIQGEGTDKEKDVRFALWRVKIQDDVDFDKGVYREGYYQSGAVLTKLADAIRNKGLQKELETYGVKIKAKWEKTSANNPILTITIL